jgi:methylated-DNA-[protein]-cysteine S-methyltransferase
VYDYIRRIPEGRVSTYALIAKGIGCGSSQAGTSPFLTFPSWNERNGRSGMGELMDLWWWTVGGALRDNPFQPLIPCHRIISSTLFIGGFQGAWSGTKDGGDDGKVGRKLGLLKAEGVEFDARGYLEGGKEVLWSG